MPSLFIHDDAKADLKELFESNVDQEDAATITVILQEIGADTDLIDRLTQHGYGQKEESDFHVSKFLELWDKGLDIWRLKIWDVADFRILYGYYPIYEHYYVLAIVPREFKYDPDHPITKRAIAAFEQLKNDVYS